MHGLFLVSLLSLFCALSSAIKVMSYNVWNFDDGDSPPWEQRKVGIAQMVNELGPDLVAFQVKQMDVCTSILKLTHIL